ncbi:hypothetical protein AGABI1DRAFT_129076 [Agaricus bisporus var. burnettii JB137-S8]|uniref:Uncharacterized protein n=1 Tax=Agaricus bisporus var. burnettii (strain JB137-S8 / ATCC MYA-4627 / FGSC 10392) TaxID=597362 RepID=K5XUL7_AGABU|nr:uncharacterized protein AGABI1DRAFT_129076 [Agaricus bisporus var. burnettii JB137-S8]EKM78795.1 hypothetical protein AGABI1DRAFT_129076 [Agaricus bisporus var. burnettii JB137-S8]
MSDNEAVVMKKRRRRAIDPSLGYYIANMTGAELDEGTAEVAMRTPSRMITVDDFLRLQKATSNQPQKECKNERTVRRDFLHLRPRTVIRTTPLDPTSQSSQLAEKVSYTRKKRSFKKRIYEAAIATCVDPIRILAQPIDTPQSKPPLSFEPVDLSCTRNAPTTERKLRVANLLKPSCFSGSGGLNESRLPMTRWQVSPPLDRTQARDCILSETSRRDEDEQAKPIVPFPLEFVSLSRAEASYQVMFPAVFQQ